MNPETRDLLTREAIAIGSMVALYMIIAKMPTIQIYAHGLVGRLREQYRFNRERQRFQNEVLFDIFVLDHDEAEA